MMIKHYKTKSEALANCPEGHEIIAEGNADRRYRVVSRAEANRIRSRERLDLVGRECATPPATGGFPGV